MPTKTKVRPRRRLRRETPAARRARARKIVARLAQEYRDATSALRHTSALELLVATILSAQSTDARVNMVTPALFAKYRTPPDYAPPDPPVPTHASHTPVFFRTNHNPLTA